MTSRVSSAVGIAVTVVVWMLALSASADPPAQPADDRAVATEPGKQEKAAKYETISIRGQVVWLAAALKQRYGISTVPGAAERILALQTPDDRLHPIIEDTRGRAFRIDKRLRGTDMELLVRRYRGSPMIQVIRVYAIKQDGKYELDYYCDICAIVMYQMGPCDCCQDDNRLRERRVGQ